MCRCSAHHLGDLQVKSNEARELMVARVKAAHAQWPDFDAMPEAKGDSYVAVNAAISDPDLDPHIVGHFYATALYAAAYQGEPVGRSGMSIAVRKLAEPSDVVAVKGRRLHAGQR
jgi:hypothetical protein